MLTTAPSRRFQLILIKPSHYDDDGYVVQWLRSTMPSNSLAAVYGLAVGAAERRILGNDVDIDVTAMDETNTRVKPREIIKRIKAHGGFGLVGIIGVQSNEFPRALDICRPLRDAGIQVVIGGFHVSGCLAMLPEIPDDIKDAQRLGISIFAGEAEGRLDEILYPMECPHWRASRPEGRTVCPSGRWPRPPPRGGRPSDRRPDRPDRRQAPLEAFKGSTSRGWF